MVEQPGAKRSAGIVTVDVEDWFHILEVPSTPDVEQWTLLPSRVERNFEALLQLFAEHEVRTTCFFLGWVASRFPHLVKEAARAGHEIASHGFAHRLVYQMERTEFRADIQRARQTLEDISGAPVLGYRAPGFSSTEATPWFFDEVAEAGYLYDSSVFPMHREHGGMQSERAPHMRPANGCELLEVPITVAEFAGVPMCFFGGGYLRLFPYWLMRSMGDRVLEEGRRPIVFYVHPREIDPGQPRLEMSARRRFKTYVNLQSTRDKLVRILQDFELSTVREWMTAHDMTPRVRALSAV